jgi:hypothetical protein
MVESLDDCCKFSRDAADRGPPVTGTGSLEGLGMPDGLVDPYVDLSMTSRFGSAVARGSSINSHANMR